MILLHQVAEQIVFVPAYGQRSLCERIDAAVWSLQRCEQQRAAQQAACVPHRAHVDIDLVALSRIRGESRHHHDRGNVTALHLFDGQVDAELGQHIRNRLACGTVAQRITATGQADHQSIADQAVVAPSVYAAEIFEPYLRRSFLATAVLRARRPITAMAGARASSQAQPHQ